MVEVTTRKSEYEFDAVIFAIRPQDYAALNIHEFKQFKFKRISYQVKLIRATGKINMSDVIVDKANEMLAAIDSTFGTQQVNMSGHLGGLVAEWPKDNPDVLVLIGNGEDSDSFDHHFEDDLDRLMNFTFKETFFSRIYDQGPNYLEKERLEEFTKWIENKQGKDGFFYIGEFLAGHGVPENFQFSKQFAAKYFPGVQPTTPHTYPTYPKIPQAKRKEVKYLPHQVGAFCKGEEFHLKIGDRILIGIVDVLLFALLYLIVRHPVKWLFGGTGKKEKKP